jgi:hypothetical protein
MSALRLLCQRVSIKLLGFLLPSCLVMAHGECNDMLDGELSHAVTQEYYRPGLPASIRSN